MLYAFLFVYENVLDSPRWDPSAQRLSLLEPAPQARVTWRHVLDMLQLPGIGMW